MTDWTTPERLCFTAQLVSTWALVGLIWTVQLVHYPLFDHVAEPGFAAFHRAHSLRISWLVLPLMLVELATVLIWAWKRPPGVPAWMVWVGLVLTASIWLATALLQVPLHRTLSLGFDAEAHRRLVVGNWVRTLAWSGRGLLLAYWLLRRGG